jgi:molybdopterin synthase catalytic subunit
MALVAGLLLAAGAGRRMGVPKALLRGPDGLAWVVRAVEALVEGGCDPVWVVVGAAADEVAGLLPAEARAVRAADWAEGMGASLRAGLAAVTASTAMPGPPGPAAVLVTLVDTPGVSGPVVARLAAVATPSVLARAGYGAVPGHPVLLGRDHWAGAASAARGDAGARSYLAGRDVVLVECGDLGTGADLDTPGDVLSAYGGPVSTPSSLRHPALAPEHAAAPRRPDTTRLHEPARRVVLTALTTDPLDVAAHEAAVARADAGAVVSFSGVVRDHDGGRSVIGIEYVGHPTAAAVLAEVVAEVAARTDVEAIAVSHRLGPLAVGEAAIVVAVAGAHRQEAFAAAALLVDEVKHRLPVWKRQQFPDGTDEWVACP